MTDRSTEPHGESTPIAGPHAAGIFLSVLSFRGGRPLIYFAGAVAIIGALIGFQYLLAHAPGITMSAPPDYCAIEADDALVGRHRRNVETRLALATRDAHAPLAMTERLPFTYELVGLFVGCAPLAALRAGEDVSLRPWLVVTAIRAKALDVPIKFGREDLLKEAADQYGRSVGDWRFEEANVEERAAGRGDKLAYVVVAVDSDGSAFYMIEEERDPVVRERVLDITAVGITAVHGAIVRVEVMFDPADQLSNGQLLAQLKAIVRKLLEDNDDL